MRKITILVVLFLLMAALPLAAETCDTVLDSRAYDDGGSSSWCWLSSMICYYCWGSSPDEHCASDWEPCDASPPPKRPHPIVVEAKPLPIVVPPCAAKTLEPAQQVKLEHIL
ncbi:MAG TPA: hypothetical protein VEO54_27180 [Thermoanaerobaculia bacterium]|nr:hypothetical protein [Thermoanaerobaculia bacterium]